MWPSKALICWRLASTVVSAAENNWPRSKPAFPWLAFANPFTFIASVAALILGFQARSEIARAGGGLGGQGLAHNKVSLMPVRLRRVFYQKGLQRQKRLGGLARF